jgi:hypothetical protein
MMEFGRKQDDNAPASREEISTPDPRLNTPYTASQIRDLYHSEVVRILSPNDYAALQELVKHNHNSFDIKDLTNLINPEDIQDGRLVTLNLTTLGVRRFFYDMTEQEASSQDIPFPVLDALTCLKIGSRREKIIAINLRTIPNISHVSIQNYDGRSISFKDNSKLETVDIQGDNLATIDVSGLINLRQFRALGCNLTKFATDMNNSGITFLNVSHRKDFSETLTLNFDHMPNLEALYAFNANLAGSVQNGIGDDETLNLDKLRKLKVLNLKGRNRIRRIHTDGRHSIQTLYLQGSNITVDDITLISSCRTDIE